MRAILIDPESQTLTEVQHNDELGEIRRLLRCHSFTTGAGPLPGSVSGGFDTVYCCDDELRVEGGPRFWFQVDADRNPPSSFPIAGPGLVYGIDRDGATCDAHISLAELQQRITFTQRKFRGYKTLTGTAADARGADIAVDIIAPVIDGTGETKPKG